MKKTLKLILCSVLILSVAILTLGSCDFDISSLLGQNFCVHEWNDGEVVDKGDCQTPGLIRRECSKCGATDEKTTALGDHIESDWIVDEEATCIDGSMHTECTVCGVTVSKETIIATGEHTESDWIVDVEATCIDGLKHTECTVCGVTISTETILSTSEGHKYENYN